MDTPFSVGDKVKKYTDGGYGKNKFMKRVFEVTEIHAHTACQSGWLMTVVWKCDCCGSKEHYKNYDSDWFKKV